MLVRRKTAIKGYISDDTGSGGVKVEYFIIH